LFRKLVMMPGKLLRRPTGFSWIVSVAAGAVAVVPIDADAVAAAPKCTPFFRSCCCRALGAEKQIRLPALDMVGAGALAEGVVVDVVAVAFVDYRTNVGVHYRRFHVLGRQDFHASRQGKFCESVLLLGDVRLHSFFFETTSNTTVQ